MKSHTAFLTVAMLVLVSIGASAQGPGVEALHVRVTDDSLVPLDRWLADNGPAVILVWATWAPRSERALEALDEISRSCIERGFSLAVVDVQESFEDGRNALDDRTVPWAHDRHGLLLKHFRIIKIPTLLMLESDGTLLSQGEVVVDTIEKWGRD
ncbi:MAG: hypothetical protein GY906_09870 [bacterium]|nr:hypothetical protein [bacterium]